MNQLVLPPQVLEQIDRICAWYDELGEQAAESFLDELERSLRLLRDNPHRYPISHETTRRAKVRRFPYKVYYRIAGLRITVVSILHDKRNHP